MFRYADPAMDAEAYYQHVSANRRQWELENYVGDCPLCGKPMYKGDADFDERAEETDEFEEGYAHCGCLFIYHEDKEQEAWERQQEKRVS